MSILDKTRLGRSVSALADKSTYSRAFQSTPLGGLVGSAFSSDSAPAKKQKAATPVATPSASGFKISEETVKVLENIDQHFKDVLDALGVRKQQEEAAKEEAQTEAQALPIQPPDAASGGESGGGLLGKFGKLAGLVSVLAVQFAYPIYKFLSEMMSKFSEAFQKVKDFFKDKVVPIFTETIPEFFTETIPHFFTETLPELFFDGVSWIKDKFDSMLDMFSGAVANIKKKIGGFIVDIADSGAAKLLLSDETRSSIRSFGSEMVQSGDKTLSDIDKKKSEKAQAEADKQAAPELSAPPSPQAIPLAEGGKKLSPFELEFAKQRKAQGPGGVFTWTDPATGKTGKYTTNYKEEDPSAPVSRTQIEPGSSAAQVAAGQAEAVPSQNIVNIAPTSSGGGSSAAPEQSTPKSSGAAVASASMTASAPEGGSAPTSVSQQSSSNMNKPKMKADEVNPIANVPEVNPSLGNIANLWYHNSAMGAA